MRMYMNAMALVLDSTTDYMGGFFPLSPGNSLLVRSTRLCNDLSFLVYIKYIFVHVLVWLRPTLLIWYMCVYVLCVLVHSVRVYVYLCVEDTFVCIRHHFRVASCSYVLLR